jgi:hypothetical protein
MLTPERIQELNDKYGVKPASNARVGERLRAAWGIEKPPRLGEGAAGEFAGQAVRAVGEPLLHFGGVMQKGVSKGVEMLGGKVAPEVSGEGAIKLAEESAKTSDTTAGDVGRIVGTIAPYFIGVGEVATAKKVATLLPKLAEKLGVSAESLLPKIVGYLAKTSPEMAKNFGIATAQTGEISQGVETALGAELFKGAGLLVSAFGKGIYKGLAIPTSAKEARMLQIYKAKVPFWKRMAKIISGDSKIPVTADETAFQNGFFGTESMIGVQAKRAKQKLWKEVISPALKRSNAQVNMDDFFSQLRTTIVNTTPEKARQNALLEALDALKTDYAGTGVVNLEKLQSFKEGWAKFVPEKAYKGQPIAGAFNDVKNLASNLARQTIYQGTSPEVRKSYIDYGNLKGLEEWGQKAMTGGKFKGGAGSFVSAMKDAVITPIATAGGLTIYKVGEGMEFVGAPGARYLSELFTETEGE